MNIKLLSLAATVAATSLQAATTTVISENFDGGAVNSAYAFSQRGDNFGGAVQNTGGPNGRAATLTKNSAGNHNTLAWDAVAIPSGINSLRLSFDFFATDDFQSICCDTAADGIGFGFVPVAVIGSGTGAAAWSPNVAPSVWERPRATGALMFGIDLWDSGGETGNSVNASLNGNELGDVTPASGQLNNNDWHRIIFNAVDIGGEAELSATLVYNVNSASPVTENIFSGVLVPGLDINALGSDYRLIAGGRTGGASAMTRIDNVSLTVDTVPEPTTLGLAALGAVSFFCRRRA